MQGAVSTEIYLTYLRELQYPMLALISVVGVASLVCVREGETILTGNFAGPVQSRRTAVDCSVAAAHCTAVMVST